MAQRITTYHNHLSVDLTTNRVTVDRNEQLHERNRVGNRRQLKERHCGPLHARTTRSRWGPNVFSTAIAFFVAMVLQWGTASSAIVIALVSPTIGKLELYKYPMFC